MAIDPTPAETQTHDASEHDAVRWFHEHYREAAGQVIDFVGGDNISLEGRVVADIGSGDGIIDLGIFDRARPKQLVGYDVRPTDVEALRRASIAAGRDARFPDADQLAFAESQVNHLPAPNDTFDFAFSWSVFEHVDQPIAMLREVNRVLKPDGYFFLQLWPFFGSQHGGHLWQNIADPFAHLTRSPFELNDYLAGKGATDPSRPADDEFRSLSRITVDGLQRALLAAQLRISKVELISETVHVPPALSHLPLTDLVISGIKLLAAPF